MNRNKRSIVVDLEDPRFGTVRNLAPPIHFDRTPARITCHAPRLGEHTDEVLCELGVVADQIDRLKADGVIG